MAKNEKYDIIIGSIAGAVFTRQLLFRIYHKGVIIMKFKNLVMLAAALTCIAGSTVMAEEKAPEVKPHEVRYPTVRDLELLASLEPIHISD